MTEEQVIIVDENNKEIGVVPRSVMRAKNLWYRGTAVLVFNAEGEIFVHQRTFEKDVYPGYYDLKVGGAVEAGETYDENVARELEEELGIRDVSLKPLFILKYDGEKNRTFCKVFKCIYDGPLKFQKEEIISGMFVSLKELRELIKKEKFTPEGLKIIKKYLEEYYD